MFGVEAATQSLGKRSTRQRRITNFWSLPGGGSSRESGSNWRERFGIMKFGIQSVNRSYDEYELYSDVDDYSYNSDHDFDYDCGYDEVDSDTDYESESWWEL
jgi:hypothetical protein